MDPKTNDGHGYRSDSSVLLLPERSLLLVSRSLQEYHVLQELIEIISGHKGISHEVRFVVIPQGGLECYQILKRSLAIFAPGLVSTRMDPVVEPVSGCCLSHPSFQSQTHFLAHVSCREVDYGLVGPGYLIYSSRVDPCAIPDFDLETSSSYGSMNLLKSGDLDILELSSRHESLGLSSHRRIVQAVRLLGACNSLGISLYPGHSLHERQGWNNEVVDIVLDEHRSQPTIIW